MYIYLPHLAYPVQAPSWVTSNDDICQRDNLEKETARRSTNFLINSTTFRVTDTEGSYIIRCDEYDVDENGGEDNAGWKDNRK